jgi:putative transposon-encoded protein
MSYTIHIGLVKYMTTFTLEGKELIRKTVAPHGGGAMVYVPKKWIGKTVSVVLEGKE